MIAKVRIAPVERWCEAYLCDPKFLKLAGIEVEIITNSMIQCGIGNPGNRHVEPCKVWFLTSETKRKCESLLGHRPFYYDSLPYEVCICEHLLEMD